MRRIGILETSSADSDRLQLWELFRQRLRELGYAEGQDISFESRWAQGKANLLPELAAELVRLNVDAIVTAGTPAAFAAKQATTTIPIVMATGVSVDPALNESPRGSAGNVTGLSDLAPGLSRKRLELLSQVVPDAAHLAVLWDQTNQAGSCVVDEYQDAARSLGLSLEVFGVSISSDFDHALSAMIRNGAGGFIGVTSAMFFGERKRLAVLALEHRLPAMFVRREYADVGALMAFGAPIRDNYRRAAGYVDKIFRGARPADLPVEVPVEFELAVNMKTAQVLGLTIPQRVLDGAQQVE